MVQDSWYEGLYKPDGHPIINYLDNYRERLLAWNKSEFGHVGHKIDSLQKRLQMLETLPSTLATDTEISDICSALNVWLDAENTMWRQRSRNFWFTEGDWNTSFFHKRLPTANRETPFMVYVMQMGYGKRMNYWLSKSQWSTSLTCFT